MYYLPTTRVQMQGCTINRPFVSWIRVTETWTVLSTLQCKSIRIFTLCTVLLVYSRDVTEPELSDADFVDQLHTELEPEPKLITLP